MIKVCGAPECKKTIGSKRWFCSFHWFRLPEVLRAEINRVKARGKGLGVKLRSAQAFLREQG